MTLIIASFIGAVALFTLVAFFSPPKLRPFTICAEILYIMFMYMFMINSLGSAIRPDWNLPLLDITSDSYRVEAYFYDDNKNIYFLLRNPRNEVKYFYLSSLSLKSQAEFLTALKSNGNDGRGIEFKLKKRRGHYVPNESDGSDIDLDITPQKAIVEIPKVVEGPEITHSTDDAGNPSVKKDGITQVNIK